MFWPRTAMLGILWFGFTVTALAQETRPALPAATLVSLKLTDATPDAAMAEIARQSGYPLVPYDDRAWQATIFGKVSLSLDKAPFWAAVREVCGQGGVSTYFSGYGDRRIMLLPTRQGGQANHMKCPASCAGPFMIVVSRVQRSGYVDLSNPQNISRSTSLTLTGFCEPKIKLVQHSYYGEVDEAVDEKGLSLAPPTRGRPQVSMNPMRGLSWNMYVGLQSPPGAGDKLARLRGKARVMMQTGSTVVEIPNVLKAKGVTNAAGGYSVTLKMIAKTEEQRYEANVTVSREGGFDPKQINELASYPMAKLLDAQGREYVMIGSSGWRAPTGPASTRPVTQMDLKLQFYRYDGRLSDAAGEPVKLVWEFTTGMQEVVIPFEFTNIALP